MAEIIIDIDANGDVRIEGKDIVGPECETLTAEIEQALGTVTATRTKPEYHQRKPVARKANA